MSSPKSTESVDKPLEEQQPPVQPSTSKPKFIRFPYMGKKKEETKLPTSPPVQQPPESTSEDDFAPESTLASSLPLQTAEGPALGMALYMPTPEEVYVCEKEVLSVEQDERELVFTILRFSIFQNSKYV